MGAPGAGAPRRGSALGEFLTVASPRFKLGRTADSEAGQQHWWDEAAKLVNKVDDPEADHYEHLVRRWWSEHRSYPEARKPKEHKKPPPKDYALPLDTVHEGDTVRIPASEPEQGRGS